MSMQLQPRQRQDIVASPTAIGDPFAAILTPAKPALDAMAYLKGAIDWIAANSSSPYLTLNVQQALQFADEAADRLQLIPPTEILRQAGQLFEDAVRIPAPPAWLHIALGIMLNSMPNAGKVSPSYRFGVVDSMLNDEEFAPGFSEAVVFRAIRQVRKAEKFVPSPAQFLEACKQQKRIFDEMHMRTEQLISIRENAEAVLAEDKRQFEENFPGFDEDIRIRELDERPFDEGQLPF